MRDSTNRKYRHHKKTNLVYGGDHLTTRLGRSTARPISVNHVMHIVLRSSQANGKKRFTLPANVQKIESILSRFSERHGVVIWDKAINHNHMHLALELCRKESYPRFIKAISGSIALSVGGNAKSRPGSVKFWDRRPFTRIVKGPSEEANLADYLAINRLEAGGYARKAAREELRRQRKSKS